MKQNENIQSTGVHQRHGISLNKAVLLLQQHLGDKAPSRATLHRHSSRNMLAHLSVRGQGSRQYFDPEGLLAFYKDLVPTEIDAPGPAAGPTLPAPSTTLNPDQLAAMAAELSQLMLNRLEQVLAPLAEAVAAAGNHAQDLNKTRTSLMLKYDAAANLTQQRLEAATAEIQRLRSEVDLREQMTRLRIDMSRLQESVSALQPKR